uniref:RNA-directed DNA polymerase n=1 Tax=Bos mutus grunniens TaxID=30521 RepID=A0A8B9W4D7_BOSMU
MGIADHLTSLLRKLYAGQETTVRTGHGTTDWFQIGKGVLQGCILSPCLFNLYAEYIMRNAGLEEAQAGIKIAGRNINKLRYADDTTLMAESEEELKSLLMKVEEESEKVVLKLNTQKMKIMASGPITSWEIDGETVETVSDFIFLGSKITADGDCSHEIKRHFLLGRKVMTNLDSLLRKLYAGQETTVRTGHGTTDWFQIGKGVLQGCILSPCLFNLYAEYIMRNAGLEEAQAGIKIAGRNINKLRYADDTTLMAESEEELKSLLMKVEEESEKVVLKLNTQKMKIMASGPITSWEIDGETVETVSDFIFLGSKITADGDCSHEIKRHFLLGRKVMTNLDSIFKSRDITLPTKVHLVKAMVFPVVMYGCEIWTVKKAEHQRIDTFELWCWRRLLRVPWTARRSNQSILKEISPGISLEGMMLKLKLQYFGHLMQRVDLLEKTLMLGGLGQEEKGMTEDEMAGWHH